jgi:hypothetical protein
MSALMIHVERGTLALDTGSKEQDPAYAPAD